MMALSKMKSFNVDFTVLKKTNIIKTLKGLEKMDFLSDSIKKELRSVHKMWKEKVFSYTALLFILCYD